MHPFAGVSRGSFDTIHSRFKGSYDGVLLGFCLRSVWMARFIWNAEELVGLSWGRIICVVHDQYIRNE